MTSSTPNINTEVANVRDDYTGDGSTQIFSITFPYLDETDVLVIVDDVLMVQEEDYFFGTPSSIQFYAAPAIGAEILIRRNTDVNDLKAVFAPGSAIRARDLNDNFTQTLYIAQEADDLAERAYEKAEEAIDTADQALQTANTAINTANNAVDVANQATADAASAVAASNTAVSAANAAEATANRAESKVDAALVSIADVLDYKIVATAGDLPASAVEGDAYRVLDSTNVPSIPGIQSLPLGFVGDPGKYVNLTFAGGAWTYISYGITDPDNRYQRIDVDTPPIIDIVTLTAEPSPNRFTSSQFRTDISMRFDGVPTSSRALKVVVTGDTEVPVLTSDIANVQADAGQTAGTALPDIYSVRFEQAAGTSLANGPATSSGTFSIWAKSTISGLQNVADGINADLPENVWSHVVFYGLSPSSIGANFTGLLSDAYFFEGKSIPASAFVNDEGYPLEESDLLAAQGDWGVNGYHWKPDPGEASVANGTLYTPQGFTKETVDNWLTAEADSVSLSARPSYLTNISTLAETDLDITWTMVHEVPSRGGYLFVGQEYIDVNNVTGVIGFGTTPTEVTQIDHTFNDNRLNNWNYMAPHGWVSSYGDGLRFMWDLGLPRYESNGTWTTNIGRTRSTEDGGLTWNTYTHDNSTGPFYGLRCPWSWGDNSTLLWVNPSGTNARYYGLLFTGGSTGDLESLAEVICETSVLGIGTANDQNGFSEHTVLRAQVGTAGDPNSWNKSATNTFRFWRNNERNEWVGLQRKQSMTYFHSLVVKNTYTTIRDIRDLIGYNSANPEEECIASVTIDGNGDLWVTTPQNRIFYSNDGFDTNSSEITNVPSANQLITRPVNCEGQVWFWDDTQKIAYGTNDYGVTWISTSGLPNSGPFSPHGGGSGNTMLLADNNTWSSNNNAGYNSAVMSSDFASTLTFASDLNLSKYTLYDEVRDLALTKSAVVNGISLSQNQLTLSGSWFAGDKVVLSRVSALDYFPDISYDSPADNVTWLTSANSSDVRITADSLSTGVVYGGQVGITYYYEVNGVGHTVVGGDAITFEVGKHYNFGTWMFRDTQPGATALLAEPGTYIKSYDRVTFDNSEGFDDFSVGETVTELSDIGVADAVGTIYDIQPGANYMDIVTGTGNWSVGSAVVGGTKVISGVDSYARFDPNGFITTLTTSDPGYSQVTDRVSPTVTFPATFLDGTPPDDAIAVGASINVEVQAYNTEGSVTATTNTITPV